MPITLPPLEEQRAIADYLDERCRKVDALVAEAYEVIETMREYRLALITGAVTGRVDVRGAAWPGCRIGHRSIRQCWAQRSFVTPQDQDLY
jgi:hypothetical protein